jgi:hypothetical protein
MKKGEPWINTITYVVTYLFRCNIDITSLHSGMAIKGVLLYHLCDQLCNKAYS